MVNSYNQFTAASFDSQHIKISTQLHLIEAQERHEKSSGTTPQAICGSSGGLLIHIYNSSFIFIHKTTDVDVSSNILFKKWWTGVKIKCKNLSLFIFGDRDV